MCQNDKTNLTKLTDKKERVKRDINELLTNPTYPNNCLILHADIKKSVFESEDIPDMFGKFGNIKEYALFESQAVVEFSTVKKNKIVEDPSFTIKFTNLNRNVHDLNRSFDRGPKTLSGRDIRKSSDRGPRSSSDRDIRTFSDRGPRTSSDRDIRTSFDRGPRTSSDRDIKTSFDRGPRTSSDRDIRTSSDRGPRTSSGRDIRKSSDRDIGTPTSRSREDKLLQDKNVDLKDVLKEMKRHGGSSISAQNVRKSLDKSSSWEHNRAYPDNRSTSVANHDVEKLYGNQRTHAAHFTHVNARTHDVQSTGQHDRTHNVPYINPGEQSNNEQYSRTFDKGYRDVEIRKLKCCIRSGVESDHRTCVGCTWKRLVLEFNVVEFLMGNSIFYIKRIKSCMYVFLYKDNQHCFYKGSGSFANFQNLNKKWIYHHLGYFLKKNLVGVLI